MNRRMVSIATTVAMLCCFCGVAAYAKGEPESKEPAASKPAQPTAKTQPNEKLKADLGKLVAETKAGKRSVIPATQFPPPYRNNLSKGAKIAIVAGIAGAIIFIALWYTTGPGSD